MRIRRVVAAAAFAFSVAALASNTKADGDGFSLSLTPYAWLPGIERRFGRVGFYADGGYMRIGMDDASGRFGLADVDVVQRVGLVDFGLMYRFVDRHGEDSRFALDATAGARYWNVELEIDPANVAGATREKDWLIPTVGLRGTVGFARRWEIVVGGDVGGVGAASDFSWSAIGTIGYNFNIGSVESTIFAGYRPYLTTSMQATSRLTRPCTVQ